MKIVNPATGAVIADVAADSAAAVREKYEMARAGQPAWARVPLRKRLAAIAGLSRSDRGDARNARAHAHRGGRQADPPIAQRVEWPPDADRLLSRRVGEDVARGEGLRRRRAEARRADQPRAARRHRQHLGVELPLFRGQQRVRPGADRRQCGALQAVRIRDAHRPAHRRNAARGRRPDRRVRAGDRRRRHRRCAAAPAAGRRLLHRLVWHGCKHRGRRRHER